MAFCCGLRIYVDGQHCSFLPSPLLQEGKTAFSSQCVLNVGLMGRAESTDLCLTVLREDGSKASA